ncbi:MAG: twin-arginine translocase subunit TatB [Desulfovibrionales bacterium]|nr:twin-arginine translocase subunit TatB [Desulfovibrionales bacterium]
MFGIGSTELLVILVVALIILGPSKLPEIAKSLGKALGEFRRVSTDVKRTIEMEAEQAEQKAKTEQTRKELFPQGTNVETPQDQTGATKANDPAQPAAEDRDKA